MLDILFIVLVVFVFLIGINYNKEGFETQPDDLYQTEPINTLTKKLNEYLQALITSIGTMVSTIETNITGEVNKKIDWIKGCAGCVKFCGKEPYWCNDCCGGSPYPCNYGCKGKNRAGICNSWGHRSTCHTPRVGCTQWRDNCTGGIPKWNCSEENPSGFSPPTFPNGWTGISERSC